MGSRPVLDWRRAGSATDGRQLTKLLVNVTVERSLGPLHVLLPGEKTVADLIGAAVHMYVKEGRRPLLANADPKEFELHYNQYSFESLDPEEKLTNLGSRNFFMCSKAVKQQNE